MGSLNILENEYLTVVARFLHYHRFAVLMILITFTVLLNTLINTHIFSVFYVIPDKLISTNLVVTNRNSSESDSKLCNASNLDKEPLLNVKMDVAENMEKWSSRLGIREGGEWYPLHCCARYLVALVIPYRNRSEHLKIFSYNIHPFLQKQNIHYRIFVVEQNDKLDFNRGKLLNVGFVEALKLSPFPCFIFHDVDLIPINFKNIYACTEFPRHVASSIDKYRYQVPYDENFGGVTSILSNQFIEVNGFSNNYFGWGGEDDDFFQRVRHYGFKLSRFKQHISRYISLGHDTAKPSELRYQKLSSGYGVYKSDGLTSLKYTLQSVKLFPAFTKFVVAL